MGEDSSGRRRFRIFRPDPGAEVNEELAYHLEQRIREYEAQGMDPDAARAAALQRLGRLDRVRRDGVALLASERRSQTRRHRLAVSWLDFKLAFGCWRATPV